MTNRFDANAIRTPSGWIAYYREVHHSKNFILRDGCRDIIFPTKAAAKEAAWDAFLAYLNSPISGLTVRSECIFDEANATFNLAPTTPPAPVKQRGKQKRITVEHKAKARASA